MLKELKNEVVFSAIKNYNFWSTVTTEILLINTNCILNK